MSDPTKPIKLGPGAPTKDWRWPEGHYPHCIGGEKGPCNCTGLSGEPPSNRPKAQGEFLDSGYFVPVAQHSLDQLIMDRLELVTALEDVHPVKMCHVDDPNDCRACRVLARIRGAG